MHSVRIKIKPYSLKKQDFLAYRLDKDPFAINAYLLYYL